VPRVRAVRFSLLLFRPRRGDLLVAKVKAQDAAHGVQLSTGFCDDIVVPPHLMKGPSEMRWVPPSKPGGGLPPVEGHWQWVYRHHAPSAEGGDGAQQQHQHDGGYGSDGDHPAAAAGGDDDGAAAAAYFDLFTGDSVRLRVEAVLFNDTAHHSQGPNAASTAAAAAAAAAAAKAGGKPVQLPPGAPKPGSKPPAPVPPAPVCMPLDECEDLLLDAAANRLRPVGDLFVAGGHEGDGTSLPALKRAPLPAAPAAASAADGDGKGGGKKDGGAAAGAGAAASSTGRDEQRPKVDAAAADPGERVGVFPPARSLGGGLPLYTAAMPVNRPGLPKVAFRPAVGGGVARGVAAGGGAQAAAGGGAGSDRASGAASVMTSGGASSSSAAAAAAAGLHGGSAASGPGGVLSSSPMVVLGSIGEDGLGALQWWPGEEGEGEAEGGAGGGGGDAAMVDAPAEAPAAAAAAAEDAKT
jgi:hypothetical protein